MQKTIGERLKIVGCSEATKRTVYSDQNAEYLGLRKKEYTQHAVNQPVKEFVNGQAYTPKGSTPFRHFSSVGTTASCHHMSVKHLKRRYVPSSQDTNTRSSILDTLP